MTSTRSRYALFRLSVLGLLSVALVTVLAPRAQAAAPDLDFAEMTYTFDPAPALLSLQIGQSTFVGCGPEQGQLETFTVIMRGRIMFWVENQMVWRKLRGPAGQLPGLWVGQDPHGGVYGGLFLPNGTAYALGQCQ
ncbi:MAG: hypothetical protein AB1634_15540 [Thermodesulfobacteriota bacterium]